MERVKVVATLGGLSCCLCRSRAAVCAVCSTGFEIVEIGVTLVAYFEVSNENPPTNVNTVLSTTTTTTTIILIIVFPCMLIITQLLFQQKALVFIKSTRYYNLYFLSLYS
jgi:hypothetical protein